jgi:hypothetical protein
LVGLDLFGISARRAHCDTLDELNFEFTIIEISLGNEKLSVELALLHNLKLLQSGFFGFSLIGCRYLLGDGLVLQALAHGYGKGCDWMSL